MKIIIVDKSTNTVVNVVVGDRVDGKTSPDYLYEIVDDSFYVGPRFTRNEDGTYSTPYREPDPEYAPKSITRRQCAIELRERNLITAQEALDMTRTGIPPAMVQKVFDSLSPNDKIVAETDFAADNYMRSNPLLISIMTASGASNEDIDQFFISASTR